MEFKRLHMFERVKFFSQGYLAMDSSLGIVSKVFMILGVMRRVLLV